MQFEKHEKEDDHDTNLEVRAREADRQASQVVMKDVN